MVGVALAGTPSRCPRAQVASTDRAFVLSLMTDRPRGLARVWEDYCARPYRVKYSFLRIYIYNMSAGARRWHQRHGRNQERSGQEMYTSCRQYLILSILPLIRLFFRVVLFGLVCTRLKAS
jgi:hypothetical protein